MSEKPKFDFVPLPELPDHAAIEWLFEPLVMEESITMLAGEPAKGKTFMGMHVALSMATAGYRVVWIAGEGAYDIKVRAEAWLQTHGRSWPSNFIVLPREVNFLNFDEANALIQALHEQEPELVVLDSLMNMLVGGDENYAKDATLFMGVCWKIVTAVGASVLIIHHAGWKGERERGSSVLRAAPVQSFLCSMMQGSGLAPPMISLECMKNRRGPIIGKMDFIAMPVDVKGQKVLAVTGVSGAPVKTKPVDDIHIETLRAVFFRDFVHTGATKAELEEASGLSQKQSQRAIAELLNRGVLAFDGARSRATMFRLGKRYEVRGGTVVDVDDGEIIFRDGNWTNESNRTNWTSGTPKGGAQGVHFASTSEVDTSTSFKPNDLNTDIDLAAAELRKGSKP